MTRPPSLDRHHYLPGAAALAGVIVVSTLLFIASNTTSPSSSASVPPRDDVVDDDNRRDRDRDQDLRRRLMLGSSTFFDPKSVTAKTADDSDTDVLLLPVAPVEPNAHPTFEGLLEEYVPDSAEHSRYLINIGAQDGRTHDPTYPLLANFGYDGILFEGDETMRDALHSNVDSLPGKPSISWGYVTPDDVVARLDAANARRDADVLKIDIDSHDAPILERMLDAGYRPKVVMVEFNPDVAPPLMWHQMYDPHPFNFGKVMRGNYGASASAWHSILTQRFGYGLVGMEVYDPSVATCRRCEHNMWFVSGDVLTMRGYRSMGHGEMTYAFWRTHRAADRVRCLHATRPCGLFWPAGLREAVMRAEATAPPPPGAAVGRDPDNDISNAIADPDVSCEVLRTYVETVVTPLLDQMHDACRCNHGKVRDEYGRTEFQCVDGDPCTESWGIHGQLLSDSRLARSC